MKIWFSAPLASLSPLAPLPRIAVASPPSSTALIAALVAVFIIVSVRLVGTNWLSSSTKSPPLSAPFNIAQRRRNTAPYGQHLMESYIMNNLALRATCFAQSLAFVSKDRRGVTAMEYGLIAALVAVVSRLRPIVWDQPA